MMVTILLFTIASIIDQILILTVIFYIHANVARDLFPSLFMGIFSEIAYVWDRASGTFERLSLGSHGEHYYVLYSGWWHT